MSFGKARRFTYQKKDLKVSPADYYIATSLQKSCTISKGSRFPLKKDEASISKTCSRRSCLCNKSAENTQDISRYPQTSYKSVPQHSSTPRFKVIKSLDLAKIKEKIMQLNQEDIKNLSGQNGSIDRLQNTNRVKDLVQKYEHFPRGLNFWTSEEFIDDDYHSYTSSDDLDQLNKTDYYRIEHSTKNEVQRRLFEEIILEKIDKIRNNIEIFQEHLIEVKQKVDTNKNCNQNISTLQTHRTNIDSQISIQQNNCDDIKFIIYKAIDNLRKEFENKQNTILTDAIEKIKKLTNEIFVANKEATKQLRTTCDNTASELYKDIMDRMDKNGTLEFDSDNCEGMLEEAEKMDEAKQECFNYENVCRLLSNHLQESLNELDDLNKVKMNITLKCGNTNEMLTSQSSLIDMLQEEIEELKKTY